MTYSTSIDACGYSRPPKRGTHSHHGSSGQLREGCELLRDSSSPSVESALHGRVTNTRPKVVQVTSQWGPLCGEIDSIGRDPRGSRPVPLHSESGDSCTANVLDELSMVPLNVTRVRWVEVLQQVLEVLLVRPIRNIRIVNSGNSFPRHVRRLGELAQPKTGLWSSRGPVAISMSCRTEVEMCPAHRFRDVKM